MTAADQTSADLTGDTLDDAAAGTSDETSVDPSENLPVAVDRPVVSAGLRRPVLAASDLDRTLIYSGKAAKLGLPPGTKLRESPLYEDLVCVEMYDHKPLSHVTRTALASITRLAEPRGPRPGDDPDARAVPPDLAARSARALRDHRERRVLARRR